jgi:hypothetical protein
LWAGLLQGQAAALSIVLFRRAVEPSFRMAARQVFHGGAALRQANEVCFVGSDTHSPTALEKASRTPSIAEPHDAAWSQDYEQDPKSTYRIAANNQAETTTGRPWAMHTFDAVEWDPTVERVVVVSFPEHARFEPEERFPMFSGDWYKKLEPSHWEYDPITKKWSRLKTNAPRLFAAALTWDSRRKQLIGFNGGGTYHFDRGSNVWKATGAATEAGWHFSIVYVRRRTAFCHWERIWAAMSCLPMIGAPAGKRVETKGKPLPANGAAIAFDPHEGVMRYLANDHPTQYHNPTGRLSRSFITPKRRVGRLKIGRRPSTG